MQLNVIIWDTEPARIARIDRNLHLAFRQLGISGVVTCNSDPPSLFRENLFDKVPVLEVDGKHWRCKSSEPDVDACIELLRNRTGQAK
jgi:hypothetical protein